MPKTSWKTQLRAAVYRGDGAAVVALAHATPGHATPDHATPDHATPGHATPDHSHHDGPEDGAGGAWQLLGDGLIIALIEHIPDAPARATGCGAALRERGWAGDTELAAHLEAVLGTGPTPLLRSLPVDLEELADILEGDPTHSGGLINLHTGEVWPQPLLDSEPGDEPGAEFGGDTDRPDPDDPQRWLWVPGHGSHAGYHDMELFIVTLTALDTEPDLAERLRDALDGRGPFRRFKDVLAHRPDQLQRWFAFSEERHRGRARAWLATAGYRPAPRTPEQTR
jgi:hypothetical protein